MQLTSGLANKEDTAIAREESADGLRHHFASTAEFALVQRILATPAFVRSKHLTKFLRYICDCKFGGNQEEITEYHIGVQALGRGESYNPGDDNIVRNYARILRKRLEEYFAGAGQDESLRLVVPVGHYVPLFEPNISEPVTVAGEALASTQAVSAPKRWPKQFPAALGRHFHLLWISTILLLVIGAAVSIYVEVRARSPRGYDTFWRQILDSSRTTYVVPGDSGFAMLQDISGTQVHLNDYISGDLEEKFPDFNLTSRKNTRFGPDRFANYTSTADLSITLGVARLAQHYGGHFKVRYARDMHMQDFKGSNVILIGAPHANPWDELFEPESNFRMFFPMHLDGMHIDERSFINKHPRMGEQTFYANRADASSRVAYTLISFLPGAEGGGYVLMLQGQNMPGTQAAGDFLFDRNAMEPTLKKAQLADGSIGPFEILLEARTVGANAAQSRIVVERFTVTRSSE